MGWKEEFAKKKAEEEEKQRIKAEKKAQRSETDKNVKHAWDTARIYMAMRWAIPALLVILFFGFVLITWVLNQFGIYLG